jgi:hypothetical protein
VRLAEGDVGLGNERALVLDRGRDRELLLVGDDVALQRREDAGVAAAGRVAAGVLLRFGVDGSGGLQQVELEERGLVVALLRWAQAGARTSWADVSSHCRASAAV